MSTKQAMTFEQFKAHLTERFGKVSFREHGKHGWTSVEDVLERRPGGTPGTHWCDAAPIPSTQRLLGRYNFVTGEATLYEVWDVAQQKYVEQCNFSSI